MAHAGCRPLARIAAVLTVAIGLSLSAPLRLVAEESAESSTAEKRDPAKDAGALEAARSAEHYELLRLFADTLDQVERNYVKEIDRRELMEAAIRGMLAKLDQHSNYIPPTELERFRSSVENEFGGIGITVSMEDGQLVIVTPLYGTPAYRAGIRGGDAILEIDGQSTAGMAIDEAVRRMKGKIGAEVRLKIKHAADDREETLSIGRELIRVDSVLGDRRKADDRWNFFYDEEQKIGYIRITSFSRHTADDLRTALGELKQNGMRALVLDLRNNPGGLLTTGIAVCDLFVSSGRIVSTSGRNAPERVWDASADGTFDGFPMAVLVNDYSASASEIVAACLQDHKRAIVVGERTWGKGSVQNIVELENGKSALKLTTAGYLRPSGKNIHRFDGAKESEDWGVRPDEGFEVKLTEEEKSRLMVDRRKRDVIAAPKKESAAASDDSKPNAAAEAPVVDRQLQKALECLRQQLAPAAEASSVAENQKD